MLFFRYCCDMLFASLKNDSNYLYGFRVNKAFQDNRIAGCDKWECYFGAYIHLYKPKYPFLYNYSCNKLAQRPTFSFVEKSQKKNSNPRYYQLINNWAFNNMLFTKNLGYLDTAFSLAGSALVKPGFASFFSNNFYINTDRVNYNTYDLKNSLVYSNYSGSFFFNSTSLDELNLSYCSSLLYDIYRIPSYYQQGSPTIEAAGGKPLIKLALEYHALPKNKDVSDVVELERVASVKLPTSNNFNNFLTVGKQRGRGNLRVSSRLRLLIKRIKKAALRLNLKLAKHSISRLYRQLNVGFFSKLIKTRQLRKAVPKGRKRILLNFSRKRGNYYNTSSRGGSKALKVIALYKRAFRFTALGRLHRGTAWSLYSSLIKLWQSVEPRRLPKFERSIAAELNSIKNKKVQENQPGKNPVSYRHNKYIDISLGGAVDKRNSRNYATLYPKPIAKELANNNFSVNNLNESQLFWSKSPSNRIIKSYKGRLDDSMCIKSLVSKLRPIQSLEKSNRTSLRYDLPSIQLKPGYSSLWRHYRREYKILMQIKLFRQRRLTNYFINFRGLTGLPILMNFEFSVFSIVRSSRLIVRDTALSFFLSGGVFVNGVSTFNLFSQVYLGEHIQVPLNFEQISLWKADCGFFLNQKTKLISYMFNYNAKQMPQYNIYIKQSTTLSRWLYRLALFSLDVPNFLEVDFLSHTIHIVYYPVLLLEFNPILLSKIPLNSVRMYNWKYVN